MKKFTALVLALFLVASAAVMSACGDDNDNNKKNTKNETQQSEESEDVQESSREEVKDISAVESKAEITTAQLSEINSFINKYKDIPEFTSTSEAISANEISNGKTVTLISDNSNYTFTQLVSQQFISAAKSAGFKNVIADESDGTVTYFSQQLDNAVKNSDIVLMYGDINKDNIATDIEKTQANGIKVLSAGNVGKEEKDHYVDYTIPINYQLAGKLLADWSISKNKGKVNALAINNSDSILSSSIYKGFTDEFIKYVSSGYCTVLSGSSIEIGNGLAVKIKQAIENDPNLNYIIVLDDALISDAISGVEQSGKKISIISTGGSTAAFDAAENGKLEMLVAQSYEWTAYAMVDYALRVLNNSDLPAEQDVPVRIVTADSIKADLESNTYSNIEGFFEICFGANFVTGYRGLWSL